MQKAERGLTWGQHTQQAFSHTHTPKNTSFWAIMFEYVLVPTFLSLGRMPLVRVRSGRDSFLPECKGARLEFTVRINLMMIRGRGGPFLFSYPSSCKRRLWWLDDAELRFNYLVLRIEKGIPKERLLHYLIACPGDFESACRVSCVK